MKLSQFNVIDIDEHNNVFVFNTFSSAFIKISKDIWNQALSKIETDQKDDEDIRNLLKLGFVIDKDVDEVKKVEYDFYSDVFNARSLSLSIAPTMRCNFSCYYCFEGENKKMGTMTQDVADSLVDLIEKFRVAFLNIVWFGGEPLLGFNMIAYISKKLSDRHIQFSSTIITNGSLFTKQIIQELDEYKIKTIQISLDGIDDTHNRRRVTSDGKPTFDTIVNNIGLILENTDLNVSISVAVDHNNETAYRNVVDFVKNKFLSYYNSKRISVTHNYVKDRTGFDKQKICYSYKDILNEEIAALLGRNSNIDMPGFPNKTKPCMFRQKTSFAIDSNGNIYKCLEHLGRCDLQVGNVKTGIRKDAVLKTSFTNLPFENTKCRQCSVLPLCLGGCPVDRNRYLSTEFDKCCTRYKENLPKLLPYLYNKTKHPHSCNKIELLNEKL